MGKIDCCNLWKVFGPRPQTVFNGQQTREELLETGHIVAVKDVSFEVQAGEIFVVMGLSGSGKSTLVRCITRLIEPTSGSILVNGEDVLHMNKKQLRHLRLHQISMVFQRFGLFPHRHVIDNVAYGLEVQGMDKPHRIQRAHEMIELVGLHGWEQHYPHELSGGMQQRVGLARALAVNPEILLCDEPFSALDPLIRREMQDELLRLQKLMNKTMIFITHDFYEAVRLGNHIAIMKDGEIVQTGTPQQIMNHPTDDYVREFTRDIPRAKVLTARAIMKPLQTAVATGKVCSPETPLEELLPISLASDQPILVQNEQQQSLGYIDRDAMAAALVER
jgi:glycine betaine/proline transport system ATP-binding protein